MKYCFAILLLACQSIGIRGQEMVVVREGVVSFKSSQNVYVRFESTKGIEIGDTLFIYDADAKLIPVLEIKHISSISCVGIPLSGQPIDVTDVLVLKTKKDLPTVENKNVVPEKTRQVSAITKTDVLTKPYRAPVELDRQQKIRGRFAAGSYSYFSNSDVPSSQRMRYTFSLTADHLANSRFSAESYVIFRHKANEWSEVQANLATALKVYTFALKYEPDDQTEIVLGRKINPQISNIGAIDGLQMERRFKDVNLGVIVGTRPNRQDYSLDMHLFEYGAYISHEMQKKKGYMQSSLALLEQKNRGQTDRRFAYLQHNNSLVNKFNLFWSMEIDLYQVENGKSSSALQPTSIYLSLRYRASRKLSMSASYDRRNNVIYYESYKSFIDQLIEQETRQGLRFRVNYRPFKNVSLGSSAGYRSQKENPNTAKNLYSFLTVRRIPGIKVSVTLSSTLIQTQYLQGNIFGFRLTRDFFKGKLNSDLSGRVVKYSYGLSDSKLRQKIAGANVSWRVRKGLSLSLNYEATFDERRTLNRVYANLIQRF